MLKHFSNSKYIRSIPCLVDYNQYGSFSVICIEMTTASIEKLIGWFDTYQIIITSIAYDCKTNAHVFTLTIPSNKLRQFLVSLGYISVEDLTSIATSTSLIRIENWPRNTCGEMYYSLSNPKHDAKQAAEELFA